MSGELVVGDWLNQARAQYVAPGAKHKARVDAPAYCSVNVELRAMETLVSLMVGA